MRTYRDAQPPNPYLRTIRVGTPAETGEALVLYKAILADLALRLFHGREGRPVESGKPIAQGANNDAEAVRGGGGSWRFAGSASRSSGRHDVAVADTA